MFSRGLQQAVATVNVKMDFLYNQKEISLSPTFTQEGCPAPSAEPSTLPVKPNCPPQPPSALMLRKASGAQYRRTSYKTFFFFSFVLFSIVALRIIIWVLFRGDTQQIYLHKRSIMADLNAPLDILYIKLY